MQAPMLETPYLEIVAGIIGLIAGSIIVFVAPRLVAYRLEEPIPFPSPAVLIPVAGALMTRWRRRSSLAVELSTALSFVLLAAHYGDSVRLPLGALYVSLLIAIAYIDLDHRLVLNRLSYPGIVVALAGSLVWPGLGLKSALLGAVTGLAIFLVLQIISRGALGTGDTKLAVLIGAMRGLPGVLNALSFGVIIGGLAAVVLMVALRRERKEFFAYAPYLAAGAIASFFVISP